jgi:elongation factor 1-gamma
VIVASQNDKTTLLGKTKQDYASIVRWMSFSNSEVLPNLSGWFSPLIGKVAYNKKSVDDFKKAALDAIHVLEQHFLVHTFLVGERITLADLYVTSQMSRGFQYVLDKEWRAENPNTTRWFETVVNQPIWKAIIENPILVEEAVKYTPPKKEAKPAKAPEKKAEKKPEKEVEEEEEDAKPEVKAKHPLESLPKPTLILDDWKRKYSNEDTRSVALPWFWEHYKPEDYSLWKIDYKYNSELTLTFMSSNLIGGFFNRLEASRKYLFGAVSVYGQANDSVIQGAFMVRGDEALPAFDVAPDWESYEFTKLDPSKPEDKEFVEDQWSWDKPITVNGKTYEWADGKVFK